MYLSIFGYIILIALIIFIAGFIFNPNFSNWNWKYIATLDIIFVAVLLLALVSSSYLDHGRTLANLKYGTQHFFEKHFRDPFLY